MPQSSLGDLMTYLRKVCASQEANHLPDGDLVTRFVANRDEAAFAILVQRHGPMVLSVCQRLLSDGHAAEDAFQATFMVLARRAASVLRNQPLAGWLYGVARRIAVRAAAQTTARQSRERRHIAMQSPTPSDDLNWRELRTVLDEEIGRLPEKYRLPVVLCYLEGQTHEKAARELGVAKRSLTTRLTRARELLRGQLERRGITLSIAALTTALADNALATPMATMLALNTVKAAASIAAGKAVVGGLVSARALLWAEQAMTGIVKAKMAVCVCVLAVGVALGGAGLAGYDGPESANPPLAEHVQSPSPKVATQPPQKKEPAAAVDLFGNPLPDGAVGRLGTKRFRVGQFARHIAYSPNGKNLTAISDWGQIEPRLYVFDAVTGEVLQNIAAASTDWVLAISPDSKTLVTRLRGLPDNTIALVDIASGKALHEFEMPSDPKRVSVHAVAFSPDGSTVVGAGIEVSSGAARVVFWESATGKVQRILKGDKGDQLYTIAFSPDGASLATAGAGRRICFWDVKSGTVLHKIEAHTESLHVELQEEGCIGRVAFASQSKTMVSIGLDGIICLWDYEHGKLLRQLKGDMATMLTMAIAPDASMVASGGRNGSIALWDTKAGKKIRGWQAHAMDINSLAFSPDGKTLASTGQGDHSIRRWHTDTGKEIDPVDAPTGQTTVLRFAPDEKKLLSCGDDARIFDWNLATFRSNGQLFQGPFGPIGDGWHCRTFDLSPDGKVLAMHGHWWKDSSSSQDTVIRFCDVATGKELRTWPLPKEHLHWELKYSPDGKYLVTGGTNGVLLWDANTGSVVQTLTLNGNHNRQIVFSPDGRLLAMANNSTRTITIWDIAAKKELLSWDSGQDRTGPMLFSPDGTLLISATARSVGKSSAIEIRVCEVKSGKRLVQLDGLGDTKVQQSPGPLAVSPNGRIMAHSVLQYWEIGGRRVSSCKIFVLETMTGQKIREIEAPQGDVFSLAFAPNGRTLASAGADSTIILWDLTGQPKPTALSPKDLDALWSDLAADASKAEKAIWQLAFAPKQSLPFLKERMLVPPAPAEQLAKLIADLDSDRYAVRQEAVQALEKL
ncbi:MAG TPA: sigma-70 family RNA polymerase sigma factor, partial [Gemmataceae bacterium]|nr:sigma-70 family RNA polymerase sigma factor [Gemmataceae bacterium]